MRRSIAERITIIKGLKSSYERLEKLSPKLKDFTLKLGTVSYFITVVINLFLCFLAIMHLLRIELFNYMWEHTLYVTFFMLFVTLHALHWKVENILEKHKQRIEMQKVRVTPEVNNELKTVVWRLNSMKERPDAFKWSVIFLGIAIVIHSFQLFPLWNYCTLPVIIIVFWFFMRSHKLLADLRLNIYKVETYPIER